MSLKVFPSGPPTETSGCFPLSRLPWGRRSPCLRRPLAVGRRREQGGPTNRYKGRSTTETFAFWDMARCRGPPARPGFGGSRRCLTPSPDEGWRLVGRGPLLLPTPDFHNLPDALQALRDTLLPPRPQDPAAAETGPVRRAFPRRFAGSPGVLGHPARRKAMTPSSCFLLQLCDILTKTDHFLAGFLAGGQN